jgi:hypothetical protein
MAVWDQSDRNRCANGARRVAQQLDAEGDTEAAEGFRAEARSWRAGKAQSDPRAQAYRDRNRENRGH